MQRTKPSLVSTMFGIGIAFELTVQPRKTK
jgi:hypothetical protein